MTDVSTVDDYIARQPPQAQERLRELRAIVHGSVPDAEEGLAYGMPAYSRGRQRIYFGAAKRHCALYGAPLDDFPTELRGFKTSRGTVQFPLDRPVPEDLVRKLVLARFAR